MQKKYSAVGNRVIVGTNATLEFPRKFESSLMFERVPFIGGSKRIPAPPHLILGKRYRLGAARVRVAVNSPPSRRAEMSPSNRVQITDLSKYKALF